MKGRPSNMDDKKRIEIISGREFCERYPAVAGHTLPSGDLSTVKHCSAGMFGDLVAGTLLVPDKQDPDRHVFRCGFYMERDRLLLIEEDGKAVHAMSDIGDTMDISRESPAFVMFALLEYLIRDDMLLLEEYDKKLDGVEEKVTDGNADIPEDLDGFVSEHRKNLRRLSGYYKLLADVIDVLEEASAKAGNERDRQLFTFLGNKVDRLRSDVVEMIEYVLQIRDIHQSRINAHQNKVMQILTIVTTVFMPLTLITGWYGMNFHDMPELDMPGAYAAVAVIAAVVVVIEIMLFKKKKWF